MAKPIWYKLAKTFREYITEYEHVLVFSVVCAGDDHPSAALRVWEEDPDHDRLMELTPKHERDTVGNEYRIRDTIIFKADEIVCTNIREGTIYIELAYPRSPEALLSWMKQCGLAKQEAVLTGVLANGKVKSANRNHRTTVRSCADPEG